MNSKAKEFTIGVISDTHGLLRPEAVAALLGSDLILHAGDIGTPQIIPTLRRIAPVVAVRGNIDVSAGDWIREFPSTNVAEGAGLHFYILHDLKQLDLNPSAAGFAAVVAGHSHQPCFYFENDVRRNGVLYFNPGSAGPRRFSLPVTVGRIVVRAGALWPEIIELQIK